MNIKEIFEENGLEVTTELYNLFTKDIRTIKVPSKIVSNLKYFKKSDLKEIHEDEEVAKELILKIVSNLSNTYILAQNNNATEEQRNGYKNLNAEILKNQVKYSYKISSPYKKILLLLEKENVIEKGKGYIVGEKSTSYRLTKTYFGKGIVEYTLKNDFLKKRNIEATEENLKKVLACPIATSELLNLNYITFPTVEEVEKYLKKRVKEGLYNKRGKKVVFFGKNGSEYEKKGYVSAEKYIQIFKQLVENVKIPIIVSERGGNRVITAFNFMPSVLRPLVKFNNEYLEEADYSCLHPNIVQSTYGGTNTEAITHDKVADYLGEDRSVAKIGHLSFFNLPWNQMYNHKLYKYYAEKEQNMMENIYKDKKENGYTTVSMDCFKMETELMRKNITDLKELGISVLYCFDALYCNKSDYETVKFTMNKNAEYFDILTRVE